MLCKTGMPLLLERNQKVFSKTTKTIGNNEVMTRQFQVSHQLVTLQFQ